MAHRSSAFFFIALATINLAWSINFSGKADADFSVASAFMTDRQKATLFHFDDTEPVTSCSSWMSGNNPAQPQIRRSGMDMDAVHMMYDDLEDKLYVGIQCAGICGDIDGDGNPSATDPKGPAALGTDLAGICESEQFSWMIWNNPPSTYNVSRPDFYPNIIVGLRTDDCLVNATGQTELRAYEFVHEGCQVDFSKAPNQQSRACKDVAIASSQCNLGFGAVLATKYELPALEIDPHKSLYLNGSFPHIEFILSKFSEYPTFNTVDAPLEKFEPAKETKAGQAHFRLSFQGLSAAVDSCGEDAVLPEIWEIKWDCNGYPNGDAVYDVCGECDGDGLKCRDCAGTVNGTLVYDKYGVCGGNNTADCSGNPTGTKKYDRCNVCDGNDECVDCLDIPFGTAVKDKYGICNGFDYADCEGNPLGFKVYDDCGVCGGDNTSCSCQHYLGYDLADVDYALLRWTVQASLIKINDTLEVLEAIRAKLATTEYKAGSAASFVDYIDILHDFCDDCLDSFDSAQIWFASYLSEACDGIQCSPTPLSGTEWVL